MRVLLLVRSLSIGGAETQLALLAKGLKRSGHSVLVVVLYSGGPLESELRRAAIPILSLEKRGRYRLGAIAPRLIGIVRRERIDVVYTTLTAANLLGAVTRLLVRRVRLVSTLRAGHMELRRYDRWMRFTAALEPWLSVLSDRIVVNSRTGLSIAVANGFPRSKMVVVENGVDVERFYPDRESGNRLRSEWGISPEKRLVGLVGRIDPMKDHPTFLEAAVLSKDRVPDARFVCVGDGPSAYLRELRHRTKSLGLEERVLWTGPRSDMAAVYNALDVLVLCSIGEGLPNAVAEAMACGIPCVVSDVGDTRWLVGNTGIVVPPSSPEALAGGIESLLKRAPTTAERRDLRLRVVENLGVERMVAKTDAVLREVVSRR